MRSGGFSAAAVECLQLELNCHSPCVVAPEPRAFIRIEWMSTASSAETAGLSGAWCSHTEEGHRPHALISPPDVRGLVASVLAVVEREVGVLRGQPRSTGPRYGGA